MTCVNLPPNVNATEENVCGGLRSDQQLITLFSENYKPVNCRSSLEGVWQFAYQVIIYLYNNTICQNINFQCM